VNYIFRSKLSNHLEVKDKLIEQIKLIPKNPYIDKNQNILHTDWNLPRAMHREYASLFIETVTPHLHMMAKALEVDKVEIDNFWFQQYGEVGEHKWHTHSKTNYANVYFLECPKNYSTKFKHFTEDCEEGDILSFPAFLPHCSPPITSNLIKTVIAFNTNFDCE
jgi:hypothetical protein